MSRAPLRVCIAGNGPAAVEAALALHELAGSRVRITVLAPGDVLVDRPMAVLEPFAAGQAASFALEQILGEVPHERVDDRLRLVEATKQIVITSSGGAITWDALLVATGATACPPFEHAITFDGHVSVDALGFLVEAVEYGAADRIVLVVPDGPVWPFPAYELAMLVAADARAAGRTVEVVLVTPEAAPLEVFGTEASAEVTRRLDGCGVRLICGTPATVPRHHEVRAGGETIHPARVVTVPRLRGPRIPGLPSTHDGYIPTDRVGRVAGVDAAFAAGDATDSPYKQGGVACAQAEAAASAIATLAGAPIRPQPAPPVLRGVLLTADGPLYLERDLHGDARGRISEHALWWPPLKIASRRLSPRLLALAERAGALEPGARLTVPPGTPTGLRGDTAPIEILSLQDDGHDAGT